MKLKLAVDELCVETFETVADGGHERGTVHARESLPGAQCATGAPTCPYSCEETCPLSCNPTCHYLFETCGDTCGGTEG